MIRHHRLLELYLAETLGIAVDDVHDEADRLEHANEALEDDVSVLERDGGDLHSVRPFTRKEVLPRLERWFFGR